MILRSPRIPWKWNGEWAPVMPRDLKLLEWRWKDEGWWEDLWEPGRTASKRCPVGHCPRSVQSQPSPHPNFGSFCRGGEA